MRLGWARCSTRIGKQIIPQSSPTSRRKSSSYVFREGRAPGLLAYNRLPILKKCAEILLFGCVLFLAALPLQAQLPTAKVVGTVTDPSGAVIAKAKVTLTNASNGFAYTAITNSSGEYVVPNLAPANYTLKVEAEGFKTYV